MPGVRKDVPRATTESPGVISDAQCAISEKSGAWRILQRAAHAEAGAVSRMVRPVQCTPHGAPAERHNAKQGNVK